MWYTYVLSTYLVLQDHSHIYETRTVWTQFKVTSLTNCLRFNLARPLIVFIMLSLKEFGQF